MKYRNFDQIFLIWKPFSHWNIAFMNTLINKFLMKKNEFLALKTVFCLLFILSLQNISHAQLSGSYTINPNNAASNSNYKNWASAIGDMLSGTRTDGGTAQGSGVSGPVTFTVYDMVYTSTQIKITSVYGTSATNTITFKSSGGDSSKCVLQYPSGSTTTDDYVIMLDGADYINFRQIGFERTGSAANYTVVQLLNSADHNSFIRCYMKTRKVPSNVTTGWTTGVGAQVFFAGNGDTNQFMQNYMLYGYNGFYGATACAGNLISENTFDTAGCIGVYMSSQTNLIINGNTFKLGDFGSGMGQYISYAMRIESSPAQTITNNKMYMTAVNAQVVRAIVFVNISGSSTAASQVNNNFILSTAGTSSCSGISLYGINYLDLYYNNFLMTNSLAAGAIIHHNSTYTNTYVNILNNNMINKGGGLIYDFPSTNGGLDTVINNNCYATGSIFGKMAGSSYSTLSAWVTGTGKDANSLSIDPGYASSTNLHVANIGINGKAKPYFRVKKDIDSDSRDATNPDIGADEFFPIANDAGLSALDSPSVFCAGTKNVKVTFQNYGYDTLKKVEIHWKINGATQTTYNWSGSIAPGKSSSSITLGSFNFGHNTAYNMIIWTEKPNTASDGNKLNDTLKTTIYAGLSGTYTIGDVSGSSFKSFNNAITAMTSRGICGPITFNVYDGTYNEQLTIAQLPGMGASNPVIFQSISNDSTKVIIQLPSSTATGNNNAAVQLSGADYVTFKGLTIRRTGTNTISHVVHILNNSNNNTFTNCQMINIVVTSNNANTYNIWSDQSEDNNNVFRYNYIKFGTNNMLYQGVSTAHEKGSVVEYNIFDSAYSNAVQIAYNDGVVFYGNIFLNSISNVSGNYELQLLDCDSANKVMNNYFNNANTNIAIHLSGCSASALKPALTANNFVIKKTQKGILLDAVDYQNVVFNNVLYSGTDTSAAGIQTTSSTSSNIVLKNNNIVMNTGNVLNIYQGSQISASNRNNMKALGSQFAYWGSKSYTSLSALVSATSKDVNSLSVDPQYSSSTDLHIKNMALKSAGEPISGITIDFDGEARDPNKPDIGADEMTPAKNDAGISGLTQPAAVSCEGMQQVEVIIKNFGTDTLKTATIIWSVNSTSQTPYNWKGNLLNQKSDTVVVGTYSFSGNTNPLVLAATASPNGKTDEVSANDTFKINRQIRSLPSIIAGSDKNLCLGDSIQIGPSPVSGYSYTWMTLSHTVVGTKSQIYVNPSADESYVVEIKDNTAGCTNTDTIKIFVKPLPVSDFTINNQSQCLRGNSFSFTNKSTGAIAYTWDFGDGNTNSAVDPQYAYSKADTFYVELTAVSSFGCTSTYSDMVYIHPHPQSDFTINDPSQCYRGHSFAFTNNSSGQSLNSWSFGDTTSSTAMAPSAKTYNYTGTKMVTLVTENSFGCRDTFTKNLYVNPHVQVSFTVNDSTQCRNDNEYSFTNTSILSSGSFTNLWKFGNNQTANTLNAKETYAWDGLYNVTLITTTDSSCVDSATMPVTVLASPIAWAEAINDSQCVRGNIIHYNNASTPNGSLAFLLWRFGDGDSSQVYSPDHSYKNAGRYWVSLEIHNDLGCMDTFGDFLVHILPDPKAGILFQDTALCLAEKDFQFTDNSSVTSGSITEYFWDFGDGTSDSNKNSTRSYGSAGIFTITHVVFTEYGCSDTAYGKVYVYPYPTVSFTVNDEVQCLNGNHFEFTNNTTISSGKSDYFWDFGDGENETDSMATHSYLSDGNYTVWLKALSNMNCSDSMSKSILVKPSPVVNLGKDDTIYGATPKILDAGSGFDGYLWSTNDTLSQISVDSATYGLGVHDFWVRVALDECYDYDSIQITILAQVSLPESENNLIFNVFPNPARDFAWIELENSEIPKEIVLIDLYGKKVKVISMNSAKDNLIKVNLSDLPSGMYFVNIDGYKQIKIMHLE